MKRISKINIQKAFVISVLAVSVFMFQYHSAAENTDKWESWDADTMQYRSELVFSVTGEGFSTDVFRDMRVDDSIISVVDLSVYLDDAGASYMTDIIVSGDDYFIPVCRGSYPSPERLATGKPCAVLGKKLYQFTYQKGDARYIKIRGDEYEVVGYAAAENSGIFNHRVILFADCLGDGAAKDINYFTSARGLILLLDSNARLEEDMLHDFERYMENEAYGIMRLEGYPRFVESESVDYRYRMYASVIYVFSVMTVILISALWLLQQKRELAVKKAFGYSNFRLLREMAEELVEMMGIAIICAGLVVLAVYAIEKELVFITEEKIIEALISLTGYILITLPLLLIIPAVMLICRNPMKMLVDKDM